MPQDRWEVGGRWQLAKSRMQFVGGVSRSDSAVRLIALKLARHFHANAGQVKATAGGFFILLIPPPFG